MKPLCYPASTDLLMARAHELRKNRPTQAETNLYKLLHRLGEKPVNRQVIIHNMIIDIAIPARNLLIEVDGSIHRTYQKVIFRDAYKDRKLRELGFNLVRIENRDTRKKQRIKNVLAHYPRRDRHRENYYINLKIAEREWKHKLSDLMEHYNAYLPDHIMLKWRKTGIKQAIKDLS